MPADAAPPVTTTLPDSALAEVRGRWWRRARRTWLLMVLLCIGIALVLTAIDGRSFVHKLVYSLCIGAACVLFVDASRLVSAWIDDRIRAARRLPYAASPERIGWRGVIPGTLLAVVLGPTTGQWVGDRLLGLQSASMLDLNSYNTRLTLAFSVMATLISVTVLGTMERLSAARAQAQAAERQAAENQLRLLQSQLEPHMLFNTLANLRVLIGLDPARAQAMLDHLIAFLRATLNASRAAAHPLAAEFAHLADYLALMAVRMGPRLAVHFDLPEALQAVEVPPLLLQPLVENAIKHGLEPKVDGGRIEVGARRDGNTLLLTVRDTGVGLGAAADTAGTSFGLEQVRTRLRTLYGERARFTLDPAPDAEGGALARMTLPLG